MSIKSIPVSTAYGQLHFVNYIYRTDGIVVYVKDASYLMVKVQTSPLVSALIHNEANKRVDR